MKLAALFAALLAAQPGAALACSIAPDPRPVEVQRDAFARNTWIHSEALVEAVAVRGSRLDRPGIVRVVRVLKGPIRRGQILSLRSMSTSACGAGDFQRGERGLTLIGRVRGPLYFRGWLPSDYLQRLDRLGLRPIGAPAVR